MVGRKIILVVFSLLFLLHIPATYAWDVTGCMILYNGTYELKNNILATYKNAGDNYGCLRISGGRSNITIDLKDYSIIGDNNTAIGPHYGILIEDNVSDIIIKNGAIQNFTQSETGTGIAISCGADGCSNINVINIRLLNNQIGLYSNKLNNSALQIAIDAPLSDTGMIMWYSKFINLNAFSRAKIYGAIFFNISNSTITGHYDTNIIETVAQTNWIGQIPIIGWLLPPTITTETLQVQTKGMGIAIRNATNTIFKDISALGLIQGIWISDYSTNNIFGRIDLPMSGKYTGGKFGGVWLDVNAKYNQLCEINGNIIDFCNQWLLSSTCSGKYNTISDSCLNIFEPTSYGRATDISLILLTPLLPAIASPDYSFVSFLTTPFFLVIFLIVGLSIVIAKATKNATFGLYALMFLIFILTAITFTTFWIGFIFVIVIGFLLYKTAQEKKQNA